MDWNLKRGARERKIAAEVANELYQALRPAMDTGVDASTLIEQNRGLIAHIFGLACERHHLANEAASARVFAHIVPYLADLNRRFSELNRKIEKLAPEMVP